MTTDNFTETARAEAERVRDENSPLEYGTIRATFLDAFLAGAEWSRDHLAAQEPTDAVTFPRDRLGEPLDISPERFEAWLARVRRDAAREALDGLADVHRRHASESDQAAASDVHSIVVSQALHYRDAHYPEETP